MYFGIFKNIFHFVIAVANDLMKTQEQQVLLLLCFDRLFLLRFLFCNLNKILKYTPLGVNKYRDNKI